MADTRQAQDFLREAAEWARTEESVRALVVVGSWARGDATPDSDVDLVLICQDPERFLSDIGWIHRFGVPSRIEREDYGLVQSLRAFYPGELEVEFGITSLEWFDDESAMGILADANTVLVEKGEGMTHNCEDGFEKLKADVKDAGWHMIHVRADEEGPGFGYTIGLHATWKHPEIIIAGLSDRSLPHVLNGVALRVKAGERFEPGRDYKDIIERFPCRFRPVHASHYDAYVGQAQRFYGSDDFPVLQCLFPDMEGRFSWEPGCNPRLAGAQPLLDTPWAFKEPRNQAVFTTRQVMEEGEPIVLVVHDAEGDWQFLCAPKERVQKDARVVSLECAAGLDASVVELADLPVGWEATREKRGAPWKRAAF